MRLPTTSQRVPLHTAAPLNRRIQHAMEQRLHYYAIHPERIGDRLRELNEEWDIERTLETNAASIALAGFGLGLIVDKRFLALPVAVMSFLLQHALQGWCPPVPLFRRLSIRTQHEIEVERIALKILRGDFDAISHQVSVTQAVQAAE